MILSQTSNESLLSELKTLVQKEKELTHQVLVYLREIHLRKLFLARGFPSLFEFCIRYLGYSEPEAQVRIQAMRLFIAVPQVEDKVRTGTLSLSVAAQLQSSFRREDLRRREAGVKPLSQAQKLQTISKVEAVSVRQSQKILATEFHETSGTKISFTASDDLLAKLDRLRELLAHKNFDGDTAKLVNILADMALEKLAKKNGTSKTSYAAEQRDSTPNLPAVANLEKSFGRYIPAALRRAVWRQSKGCCQFKDLQTGQVCESKHGLQFDHITPVSRGGGTSTSNLQLLCSAHNKFKGNQIVSLDRDRKPDRIASPNLPGACHALMPGGDSSI